MAAPSPILSTAPFRPEPAVKRTIAFVDGQNLFHSVKGEFGYPYPNYDVSKLATAICAQKGWRLDRVHFYTGIPDPADNQFLNHFWSAKLLAMSRSGVVTYSRPVRFRTKSTTLYDNITIRLPDGTNHPEGTRLHLANTTELPDGTELRVRVGDEKGIDIRIALDIIRMAHADEFDVALVFSQDQDLSEVAREIRTIAKEHARWLRIASAFPQTPTTRNRRGINSTDWIPFDKGMYDSCLDPVDYRPVSPPP